MEVKSKVSIYLVEMECEKCKKGHMVPDMSMPVLTTFPPKYPHRCDACGNLTHYDKIYPFQICEKIEGTEEPVEFIGTVTGDPTENKKVDIPKHTSILLR